MNTARIVLAALVIFAAGVLTGAVGTGMAGKILRERPGRAEAPSLALPRQEGFSNRAVGATAKPPGNAQLEAMARWSRELNLEPAQRERIESVLKTAQDRLRDLWSPVAPRARGEIEAARIEIEAFLTPDQRRHWNEARRRRSDTKSASPVSEGSNTSSEASKNRP